MKNFYILAILFISHAVNGAAWKHVLKGPEVLTDEIIMSNYKNETEPQIHNGITVTNYFKNFDIQAKKNRKGCFVPEIKKWVVESVIFIRAKDDKTPVRGRARWQKTEEFDCKAKGGLFNTWEGTHAHEQVHYKVRDTELKKFWKKVKSLMSITCESTEDAAKMKILTEVEQFLMQIKKTDSEEMPRKVENDFYKKQKKCR